MTPDPPSSRTAESLPEGVGEAMPEDGRSPDDGRLQGDEAVQEDEFGDGI